MLSGPCRCEIGLPMQRCKYEKRRLALRTFANQAFSVIVKLQTSRRFYANSTSYIIWYNNLFQCSLKYRYLLWSHLWPHQFSFSCWFSIFYLYWFIFGWLWINFFSATADNFVENFLKSFSESAKKEVLLNVKMLNLLSIN